MKEDSLDRQRERTRPDGMTRRDSIKIMGVAAAGLVAAGCQAQPEGRATPAAAPASQPAAGTAPRVAIAQAASYDRALIRQQVRSLIDGIGGISDVVKPGSRVAIKVNLTGGTTSKAVPGVSPIESFATHPEVTRALGEIVREAGAREIFIVESVYEQASFTQWGYDEVAKAIDAKLIDLNNPAPYKDFIKLPVGQDFFFYENFTVHPLLQEIDTFISVAKVKCHWVAGITLSMKNLVGMVPLHLYRKDPKDTYRSQLHGAEKEVGIRIPRIVIDLNRARPIHLSLLDGIKTVDGGEGPWIESMAPVAAGVLLAGKSPLATDTIATAVMGFNPLGKFPDAPFLHGDNHLTLAAERKLGTNRLDEIEVVGSSINDVKKQFKPAV